MPIYYRKAPNHKTDSELIKDLIKLKELFQNFQLNEIVPSIDREINIAKKERNRPE